MRIKHVLLADQQGHNIFTFAMKGSELVKLCKVERFGKDAEGVNRQLNEDHVLEIAEAMSSKSQETLWLEPIIVALKGEWRYERQQQSLLTEDDTAHFSVDDGQHRIFAMQRGLLTEKELDALQFTVTATQGLPYELRLRIFRMQAERRPIDARLDLAQRHRLGDWRCDTDREAYELVLLLQSSPSSPLRGRIQLDEGENRPRESNGSGGGLINARGLYATIKGLYGRRSPVHPYLPMKRTEIVISTLRIASQVWPDAWNSEKHILTTARGINAVLQLFVSGADFRSAVGMDLSDEAIERGLKFAKDFDWSAVKNRGLSKIQIMEKLEDVIRRAMQKSIRNRDASRSAKGKVPKGELRSPSSPPVSAPAA